MRRFFSPGLPATGRYVFSPAAAHKLCTVLRAKEGEKVLCFSEEQGELLCRVVQPVRGEVEVVCRTRAPAAGGAGPLLAFVPLQRAERNRFLVEKATELGAGALLPLSSDRCGGSSALQAGKALEWCIGAAEQSGRLRLPRLLPQRTCLHDFLSFWAAKGAAEEGQQPGLLLAGDPTAAETLWSAAAGGGVTGVLVGPEGGLSPRELGALRTCEGAHVRGVRFDRATSVSGHTLRSDTFAVAALAVVGSARL